MPRQNLRDVLQAISIENLAVNEILDGDEGDQFRIFPSDAIGPVIPTRTPVEDNAVGDGKAYPKQSKPYYFNPINYPYAMALNSTMGQRLLRMWLGGTIGDTVNVVPGTTDQVIQMKAPGAAPMVANVVRKLGGEGFLFADVWPQTIEISQSMSGEPKISAQLMNAGQFKKLADTTIDTADFDTMDAYLKYHGAKTTLIFSDGVDTYNFASESRLIDVSFTGNQNVVVDQLPGDGFYDSSAQCNGAYSKTFFIDIQSAEMKVKVYMDDTFAQFASWLPNRKLTSVTLKFTSCELIGATTHQSEIEIKFPVAEFNLEGDTQGNFSAYSFSIKAIEGDASTGSLVIGRVRRVTGALIDETAP